MQDEKVSVIAVKVKDFLNQIVVQYFQIESKTFMMLVLEKFLLTNDKSVNHAHLVVHPIKD